MPQSLIQPAAASELRWLINQITPRRRRPQREFVESDIVLPDGGPFGPLRYRCDRQPCMRLWFNEIDSGRWRKHVALGPVQSGKTLSGSIAPLTYHLFEIGETVVFGIPTMDMAADKWNEDIFPVIERSKHRDQLPTTGAGSRGGSTIDRITFKNGATLRFMSGGGNDKKRAGFTTRVVIITEVDGMDEQGQESAEADKVTQILARSEAFGDRAVAYLECTVTTREGRIWREYVGGTESRIAIRCQHCRHYVSPEREHIVGWQDAEDVQAAKENAHWCCPHCGAAWTEVERRLANLDCKLVHRGQEIDEHGVITGPLPRTDTLGFRWTAVNNLFVSAGVVGAKEWRAKRAIDEDNAEREMCQYVHCIPHESSVIDLTGIESATLQRRQANTERGVLSEDVQAITVGADFGDRLMHWMAIAWCFDGSSTVIDYGRIEVPSESMDVERAFIFAQLELDDVTAAGWSGMPATAGLTDSGHRPTPIYEHLRGRDKYWLPAKGYGASTRNGAYRSKKTTGALVAEIGEEYHVARLRKRQTKLMEFNADYWKSWLHDRLHTPTGQPGSMTLYSAPPNDHLSVSKHLTAEVQESKWVAGKGEIIVWRQKHANNHWLDAAVMACVAAHRAGVRILEGSSTAPPVTSWAKNARATVPASQVAAASKSGGGASGGGWFAQQRRRR